MDAGAADEAVGVRPQVDRGHLPQAVEGAGDGTPGDFQLVA